MIYSPPLTQLMIALYSVVIGAFIGSVYSLMRSVYRSMKTMLCRGKAGPAFFAVAEITVDIVFSVFYTVTLIIFIYAANRGVVRYFMLLFSLIGYITFNKLIGRRIVNASEKAAFVLKKAVLRLMKRLDALFAPHKKRRNDRALMRHAVKLVK